LHAKTDQPATHRNLDNRERRAPPWRFSISGASRLLRGSHAAAGIRLKARGASVDFDTGKAEVVATAGFLAPVERGSARSFNVRLNAAMAA
jgi:hypothetical protein